MLFSRRKLGLVLAAPAVLGFTRSTVASSDRVLVFRDESCGCCGDWVEHIRAAGYQVDVQVYPSMNRKKTELGVPPNLRSCHTAQVGGYVVEGHVPAAEIRRLLATRPDARGLTVPRMPVGSPGMEVEGVAPDRYDVLLFSEERTKIFATYVGAQRQRDQNQ